MTADEVRMWLKLDPGEFVCMTPESLESYGCPMCGGAWIPATAFAKDDTMMRTLLAVPLQSLQPKPCTRCRLEHETL